MSTPPPEALSWPRRFTLRSAALYLFLNIFPFPLNVLPFFAWLDEGFVWLIRQSGLLALKLTTGFAGPLPTAVNGSGDRLDLWVEQLGILLLALAGGLVWAGFRRNAAHQARIARVAWETLRYLLAWQMLLYGVGKVALNQFPFPHVDRLVQPMGESSPMGLVWTMIGLSPAYQFLCGLFEVVAGLLLLSRRAAALGAFVMVGIMANVVLLNYCFDVSVKMFSVQLLLGAAILARPHLNGVLDLLVRRRPAHPGGSAIAPLTGWRRSTVYGLNVLLVIGATVLAGFAGARPKFPALYSTYEVVTFQRDGVAVPPLADDPQRWRYVSLMSPSQVIIRPVGGGRLAYGATVDDAARTIALTPRDGAPEVTDLAYEQTSPDQLTLTGRQAGRDLVVQLRRRDASEFLLVNRGFHWISPTPYNR